MARVACVMMQKDEVHLLEPWLSYHGYLFGYENLYVLDNGSTRPEVLLTLARYAGKGVNVDYSPSRRDHYLNKGAVVGALIPVIPYIFGATTLLWSLVLSLIGLFAAGAIVSQVTARTWWFSGLRQLFVGALAAAVTITPSGRGFSAGRKVG